MTNQEFMQLWEMLEKRSRGIAVDKGKVYGGKDRLQNFKDMRELQGVVCPERALWNVATKHLAALRSFVINLDWGTPAESKEWMEKIGDIEIYLCRLLPALLYERGAIEAKDIEGGSRDATPTRQD
jgi:hypothetical protein